MNIFDEMLMGYDCKTQDDKLNAIREVMQQIALAGLSRSGFFEKAAFYGGTCLRIFHGLNRFSEDMDFSLLQQESDFDFTPYFAAVEEEFAAVGQTVHISLKKKTKASAIQSAFLKSNTAQFNLTLERGRLINIKLEVDTHPPLRFETENKLLLLPRSFYTRCFSLPCLFAGKMHALLYRSWKNRVKGRDWYDFEWYVRKGISMDFNHFCERVRQFNSAPADEISPESFSRILQEKIHQTNFASAVEDVRAFTQHPAALDMWGADYFLQIAERMNIQLLLPHPQLISAANTTSHSFLQQ